MKTNSDNYQLVINGISQGEGFTYKTARAKAEKFGRAGAHTVVSNRHEMVFEMKDRKITMNKKGHG